MNYNPIIYLLPVALTLSALVTPVIAAEEEEPITIELPEAFFGGTPLPYWSANFEPTDYKDRKPFLAPKGTTIVSKDQPVSGSAEPLVGTLAQLTDGDKAYTPESGVQLPEGIQWVQVDLGESNAIYAVLVWHFHADNRVYFDFVAQISDDPTFEKEVTTIYNNDLDNSAGLGEGKDMEYVEDAKGRLIDAKGTKGRYVRVYGNGNTANLFNDFMEIEVGGKWVRRPVPCHSISDVNKWPDNFVWVLA